MSHIAETNRFVQSKYRVVRKVIFSVAFGVSLLAAGCDSDNWLAKPGASKPGACPPVSPAVTQTTEEPFEARFVPIATSNGLLALDTKTGNLCKTLLWFDDKAIANGAKTCSSLYFETQQARELARKKIRLEQGHPD